MSQHISTIGQIATAPRLFTPPGGAEFCTFRLASSERRYDAARSEWVDTEPNWFTVNAFRSLAVHAHESFAKGDRVVITGKLRIRAWEAEDKRGTSVEIDADGIGHDVRWGVSTFVKSAGQVSAPRAAATPAVSEAENENGNENNETVSSWGDGGASGTTGVSLSDAKETAPPVNTEFPATPVPAGGATGDGFSADGFTPEVV